MNIFIGQGYGEPIAYFIIFGSAFLSLLATRSLNKSLFGASVLTLAIYITPCLTVVAFVLWFSVGISRYQMMEDDRQHYSRGKLVFTHKYFGDAQSRALHNGFTYEQGASYHGVASDDARIPADMKQAARQAIRIDPYRTHDGVVVETTVELESGKPVIYDHIVTRAQLERHEAGGLWNMPQGAVKHNGKELPQMDSFSAAFVDSFNGPDLTKVRRR